jgi:hypothetical protein
MQRGKLQLIVVFTLAGALYAQTDPGCPRYPGSARTETMEQLAVDQDYAEIQAKALTPKRSSARANYIDRFVFDRMESAKVPAAPKTSDSEFLRRISVDLTGRIPSAEQAAEFLQDSDPQKRAKLVERLLGTSAHADQFTLWFLNKFKVSRSQANVGLAGRDAWHRFVREFVANDRPYNEFVRELLIAKGEVDSAAGTQWWARNINPDGPIHDTWDDMVDRISTTFLGYKTECVSCHDGRGHLEKINLYLTQRTRAEFWGMASFLSRVNFLRLSDDNIGFRPRLVMIERNYGTYNGAINPSAPGNRPTRVGAAISPSYMTSGEKPAGNNYREELARMLTNDRQFARATANYLWAYFFNSGIVDPPDAWDLMRVDPANPPPEGWPMQNANPELLEALADSFIQNGYRLRPLIREIVNSEAYQLSSRYEAQWRPGYARYFAKHEPRRLTAEEIYDNTNIATRTEQPMFAGYDQVLWFANQLPDVAEPWTDGRVTEYLRQLGRGDWMTLERSDEPTLLGLLQSMNDAQSVQRTVADSRAITNSQNQVMRLNALDISDEDAIQRMFLGTLTRYPDERELALVMSRRQGPRAQWLSDLQWALLNKLDFIFNY